MSYGTVFKVSFRAAMKRKSFAKAEIPDSTDGSEKIKMFFA